MKTITALICIIFLASCGSSKEEIAIADYVQRLGNIKTDMNFSMLKLELTGEVYGNDSLELYLKSPQYAWARGLTSKKLIEQYNDLLQRERNLIAWHDAKLDSIDDIISRTGDYSPARYKSIYLEGIIAIEKNLKQDSLLLRKLQRLHSDSASVICKKYEAVYSITNPLLNNAKQEVTRVFFLSPDGSKVILAL